MATICATYSLVRHYVPRTLSCSTIHASRLPMAASWLERLAESLTQMTYTRMWSHVLLSIMCPVVSCTSGELRVTGSNL